MKFFIRSRIPWCEFCLLLLSVLFLGIELTHTTSAVFAGDDGKFLAWIWQRIETGLYAPYATRTSGSTNMILGGASSLLIMVPVMLGAPLIGTALVVSALASVITLWLLFDLGRLLDSRMAGIVAVLSYLPIQNTDLRTRELVFLIPFFLSSLNLGIRFIRNKKEVCLIGMAVVSGLLANCHYLGILLLVASVVSLILAFHPVITVRGGTLITLVLIGVFFAATPVMALSLVPNWAIYLLLVSLLLWPKLSEQRHILPICFIVVVITAFIAAPGAILNGFSKLYTPIWDGNPQGIYIALGLCSCLFLFFSWIGQGFARNSSVEALLMPLLLLVVVVGSAVLELVFSISWRPYFWRPVYAVMSLATGVVMARMVLKSYPGIWSRNAAVFLILCLALVSINESIYRRLNRPNMDNEMTLGTSRTIMNVLVAKDKQPQIRDNVSLYNLNSYQWSLLYRLEEKDNATPDRSLVAYLERSGSKSERSAEQQSWLYRQQVGPYQLIWFDEDPDINNAPRISLADASASLELLP